MGKYGSAAIKAKSYVVEGYTSDPIESWDRTTIEIFGKDTQSQK